MQHITIHGTDLEVSRLCYGQVTLGVRPDETEGGRLLDLFADLAVGFYWLRYDLRKAPPRLTRGVFGKRDSSTGWAQIFAYVALRALREAEARGLTVPDARWIFYNICYDGCFNIFFLC